jgi:hypothetical protein
MPWVFLVVLLWAMPAWAQDAKIQYLLADGRVTGVSDMSLNTPPGHGLVTLIGATVADIVWPIPPGCPVGNSVWSRVTNPAGVTVGGAGLALRPGLIFFSTTSPLLPGCHQVTSWNQLRSLMNETIVRSVPEGGVVGALNYHFGWYYARCTGAETNQNCIDWKANLDQMVTAYPSRPQGITASADAALLITQVMAFMDTQCKNVPGGPFC